MIQVNPLAFEIFGYENYNIDLFLLFIIINKNSLLNLEGSFISIVFEKINSSSPTKVVLIRHLHHLVKKQPEHNLQDRYF